MVMFYFLGLSLSHFLKFLRLIIGRSITVSGEFDFLFQNIEKDQQISSLQRQLDSQTLDSSSTSNTRENSFEFPAKSKINGATQTERV